MKPFFYQSPIIVNICNAVDVFAVWKRFLNIFENVFAEQTQCENQRR